MNQAAPGTAQQFGTNGVNAHRPYLGYAAITEVYQGDTAFYQGLQVDINHRFSHSLGFGVAYTYAHSRDCGSFQKNFLPNADDPKGLCGTADYDLRQVLVLNSVYKIPFNSNSRLANEALGGWQLSQAYQFQTGTPFSVATSQDVAGVGGGFQTQFLQITPGASTSRQRQVLCRQRLQLMVQHEERRRNQHLYDADARDLYHATQSQSHLRSWRSELQRKPAEAIPDL